MTDAALHPALEASASRGDAEGARAAVQEAVRGLSRALRSILLYEGSQNPAVERVLEELRERMAALWRTVPQFRVGVEERELQYEGAPVYHGEDRESLPFLLYRDGVRELTFHRGFEREELDVFLAILARVQRVRGEDQDDLLTLLWDHDWYYLRYRYVEALPEGVALPEAEGGEPEEQEMESVREEVSGRAPEVKAVVQDAVQSVGEQVKEKAGRVKEEAKQAVKEQRPGRGTTPA